MSSSENLAWLALDIGAKQHAFASLINGRRTHGTVANDSDALRALLRACLKKNPRLRVLVEATGVYYLDVVLIAHALGAAVMVINPRTAHHFAEAINQRSKTDALDADMLLECLMRMPFQPWAPPPKAWRQLRNYGRFLVQLTVEGAADRNRLHALLSTPDSPAFLRTELKRKITTNDKRIVRIRDQAIALIRADTYLNDRFEALDSIQGVAATSAVSVLSELVTMPQTLSSRACVCHAGLDPRVFESGSSVHKPAQISRRGNKYLRRALYFPAMSACNDDPRAKAFKQRLVNRGKKPIQAQVAVMRKMLTVAWAMIKDPQPYDSARLYADLKKG